MEHNPFNDLEKASLKRPHRRGTEQSLVTTRYSIEASPAKHLFSDCAHAGPRGRCQRQGLSTAAYEVCGAIKISALKTTSRVELLQFDRPLREVACIGHEAIRRLSVLSHSVSSGPERVRSHFALLPDVRRARAGRARLTLDRPGRWCRRRAGESSP